MTHIAEWRAFGCALYLDGNLYAAWSTPLSVSERRVIEQGAHPLLVNKDHLVEFYNLIPRFDLPHLVPRNLQ